MLYGHVSGELELPSNPNMYYEGRETSSTNIQVYGMFDGVISLANISTQFALALTQRFSKVGVHNYRDAPFQEPALEQFALINRSAQIGLYVGIPDTVPDFIFNHPRSIGIFVCETNRIPKRWVDKCNQFSLIVVPSEYCRRAFQASGVTRRIMVVHHGLEPEYRPAKTLHRTYPFIFYNIFNSHLFPGRKSCEELIRSFCQAFDKNPKVQLRLRVAKTPLIMRLIKQFDAQEVISLDTGSNACTAIFSSIYSDVHCVVHPSKGEGFGLIPFQAIACETPVIAPFSSGMLEYLTHDNALEIKTQGVASAHDVYYQEGDYLLIDEQHLVAQMRYTYKHWETLYSKAQLNGESFRKQFSWPRVLEHFLHHIENLLAFT